MTTMLILTDFSDAAFHAAVCAAGIATQLKMERIILYHAYHSFSAVSNLPANDEKSEAILQQSHMESLVRFRARLAPSLDRVTKIELFVVNAYLPEGLNDWCAQHAIDCIAMGTSGKSGLTKLLLGSTANQVLATSAYPVFVIPPSAPAGKKISSVVFATDLRDIPELPVILLRHFLDGFAAPVKIVHVQHAADKKHEQEIEKSIASLQELMAAWSPEYHEVHDGDIAEAILAFADLEDASLIIAVPGKHALIAGLVHSSVARNLAEHIHIPLLAVPAL